MALGVALESLIFFFFNLFIIQSNTPGAYKEKTKLFFVVILTL